MAFVSSIQCRELTESFTFKIQKFMINFGREWQDRREVSSPEFSIDGIDNEKYIGIITADRLIDWDVADGDSPFTVFFSVSLIPSGSVTGNLSCITSIVSVSRHDALTGAASVVGKSENAHYGMVSADSKALCTYRIPYGELKKLLSDEDEVSVCVTLRLFYAWKDTDWKQESPFRNSAKRKILKRLAYEEALVKREKADLAIRCGGQEFPVHSLVLKLVSPVFHRMLETDMEEAASGRVTIDDVEPEVIERMLEFVYKSNLFSEEETPSDDSVIQLLHCAEKYGIADMKEEVLNHMLMQLKVSNAIKYVGAFRLYNADEVILAQSLEFCKRNLSSLKKESEFGKFVLENKEALF